MSKRILSPEQKEKNRIKARKYYYEHKEKCNEYKRKRRLEIKNDPILNQQMKDYKREWTRNKRRKDKENAELVIKYKEILDKIKEYITSYESINTIQECENPENNIGLDEETFIEMVNRHMKVHDKILEILEEIE